MIYDLQTICDRYSEFGPQLGLVLDAGTGTARIPILQQFEIKPATKMVNFKDVKKGWRGSHPAGTQTGLVFDRLVLKKDRSDESYTRPIRIYVT